MVVCASHPQNQPMDELVARFLCVLLVKGIKTSAVNELKGLGHALPKQQRCVLFEYIVYTALTELSSCHLGEIRASLCDRIEIHPCRPTLTDETRQCE
eukprot:COSAG06_NODE_1181_length_10363_cov_10.391563_10_plen_98_part_00